MPWRDWIRTVEIEPSVYAADFSRLGEQVRHLLNAGARVFHFDVGDGHFVEPITMGPAVLRSIAPMIHEVGGVVDVHLMVTNPEHHFPQMKAAGGDSVTFHVEACEEPWNAIALARSDDLGVGVAFNPETPVADAVAASLGADLVLCMSIHPGYSGQEFMPEALPRIREQLPLAAPRARRRPGGRRHHARQRPPRLRGRGRGDRGRHCRIRLRGHQPCVQPARPQAQSG